MRRRVSRQRRHSSARTGRIVTAPLLLRHPAAGSRTRGRGHPIPSTRRSGAATSQAPRAGTCSSPIEPFELPDPRGEGGVVDGQVGRVARVDAERVDAEAGDAALDEQLCCVGREPGEGRVGIAQIAGTSRASTRPSRCGRARRLPARSSPSRRSSSRIVAASIVAEASPFTHGRTSSLTAGRTSAAIGIASTRAPSRAKWAGASKWVPACSGTSSSRA